MSETRKVKVYSALSVRGKKDYWYNNRYVYVPQIRLQGDWLKQYGFNENTPLNVQCDDGKLTITVRQD
ncbi:SymE family type I addiction module toxin [Lactimicrobium massiliense]|uniref:SymE family type I addiction module toxin n=1 Tax=Lactimicrobium massiliense TaxID=2161814 RepID=UPI000D55E66F|nr:SymE family type I addiction module toxin [Lactimicrobium massiliense]